MGDWERTGGVMSDDELAARWREVELESRPADDGEWDEERAGMRLYVTVATLDGEEVARSPVYQAYYNPASGPGSETDPETQAEIDETALRRADATGNPVVVAGFSCTGKAQVMDVERRDGRFELVHVGSIRISPSRVLRPLAARRSSTRQPKHRARASAGGSRASPSSEPDLDPPPARRLRRWLRRLLGGGR
jgi:hypothetical protein